MVFWFLFENVWELLSHIDCHGTHPEEEADECVMGDVAEEDTGSTKVIQAVLNAVSDTEEEVANKYIDKKANSNLAEEATS